MSILLLSMVVVAVLLSYSRYHRQDYEIFYNNSRIMVTDQYQMLMNVIEDSADEQGNHDIRTMQLQNMDLETLNQDYEYTLYPYCLLDLQGNVIASDKCTYYSLGEQLNLHEVLTYDYSFARTYENITKVTFPILHKNTTIGYVLFFLDSNQVWGSSKMNRAMYVLEPVVIALSVLIIFILLRTFYIKYKIMRPICEIGESAQAIIEGNYDCQVVRVHSNSMTKNEVDNLVYGFELMRDELKDRVEKEIRLKQSQKELISCISHDLKTPISTIKAYSEGIRDGVAKSPEKLQMYADVIARKTQVLSQMISDLLDHSNAELNELSIYKEEVYLRVYLKRILEEMELYVRRQGIDFTYKLLEEDVLVNIDERRITQVLYNLVENGMKYMDKEESRIHVSALYQPKKQQVEIMVQDNGSGIGMEDIPYVFDRFYRGEKSRNMSIPGCGLGLSICRYIIEQHGGEINCKSKRGLGTEFYVSLKIE